MSRWIGHEKPIGEALKARKRRYYDRYQASLTPEQKAKTRQRNRDYYQRNQEKRRAESRQYTSKNREKVLALKRAWYQKNKERLHILRGVTGIPSIRGTICEACGTNATICMDHCHQTNHFRGWLCRNCNAALGMLKDDPAILLALLKYVERSSTPIGT